MKNIIVVNVRKKKSCVQNNNNSHKEKNMSNKIEIETLVRNIVKVWNDPEHLMERELLTRKMMRQLYRELGDPNPADYEGVGKYLYSVSKVSGYTKFPIIKTEDQLKYINGDIVYHINRPSETKREIVENYLRDGWSCAVQAYNVLCDKYMKHKDYDNIWIRFISTRDCSKYEYVLVKED